MLNAYIAVYDFFQVLFIELRLPVDGDPSKIGQLRGNKRSVGQRKGRGRTTLSTSKEVLEKLKPLHLLPNIILEWRRISNALTKVVFQLQKVKVHNNKTDMYRIFCETQVHTATGRISMTEPNLQAIPKDFDISLPGRSKCLICLLQIRVCLQKVITKKTNFVKYIF